METNHFKQYEPKTLEEGTDEYNCPSLIEEPRNNLTTTEACELKAQGLGCKHLKNCPYYHRTKKLEIKHGNLTLLPSKQQTEIKMIIKGIIIPKEE